MSNWNDTKILSMSFDLKQNEAAVDFFNRIISDVQDFEQAINDRMKQLFDENVVLGGEKSKEAYNQILKIFMLGYGHGWNDYKELSKADKKEWV